MIYLKDARLGLEEAKTGSPVMLSLSLYTAATYTSLMHCSQTYKMGQFDLFSEDWSD